MATRGYDSQVGARAQNVAVQHSPDEFGAGLGSAVANLGEAVQNARADAELSSGSAKLMAAREALLNKKVALRQGAAEDGAGHAEAMAKAWDEQSQQVLDGVSDKRVRRQLESQIQGMRASDVESETIWQVGRQTTKTLADAAAVRNQSLSLTARDPAKYGENTKAYHEYINGLTSLDATAKRKELDDYDQSHAVAYLRNVDPQLAVAMLGTSQFDFLSPEARENIKRDSETELRRAEAIAQQKVAQQKAALAEEVQTLKELEQQGVEVPVERLTQAQAAAAAIGDTSTALELDGIAASNRYTKVYQAMTPLQREQRMAALAGKAKPSAEEQRELAYARSHVGPMNEKWNSDPIGNALANGLGFSPVDWGDPASIAKRVQDRAGYERTSGRNGLPLLSDAEAQPLTERAQSGPSGRIEVLAMLDRVPARERDLVAKQIMKGDKGFAHEAQLRPEVRATVFAGRKRIETDRTFLTPEKGDAGAAARNLLAIAGREQDAALRNIDPGDLAAIKQTAGEYLAGMLTAKGRTINSLTPNDIRLATLHALGGFERGGRQYGGLSHWGTGDMDRVFVLPETMSALDFRVAVERLWQRDKPPMPVRGVYPVMIAPGEYRWETRAGNILRVKGHDYITRIGGLRE